MEYVNGAILWRQYNSVFSTFCAVHHPLLQIHQCMHDSMIKVATYLSTRKWLKSTRNQVWNPFTKKFDCKTLNLHLYNCNNAPSIYIALIYNIASYITSYSGSSLIRTALYSSFQKSVRINEFVRISETL